MKKIIALLLALAIALAFAGCSGGAAGETAAASAPRSVTVKLAENPSTGYTWSYTMDKENILRETGSDLVAEGADTGADGAPGVRLYTFEVVGDGTVKLSFEYKQEWEGGKSERRYSETYEVTDGVPTMKGFSDSASSQSMDTSKKEKQRYLRIDAVSAGADEITVQAVYMQAGADEESTFEPIDGKTRTLTLSPEAKILYSEDQGPQAQQISAADLAKKFSKSDAVYSALITDGVITSLEFCYIP